MKKLLAVIVCIFFLFSCKNKTGGGKCTITGEIKNAPDQKIYLEELSQGQPQVLDTAEIKNGRFTASAIMPGEGLYRLRLEKGDKGFLFINDTSAITLHADMDHMQVENIYFYSTANSILKNFLVNIDSQRDMISDESMELDSLRDRKATDSSKTIDSIIEVASKKYKDISAGYKRYITGFIDTVSDPVVAIFALDYTGGIDPDELEKTVANLGNRFPQNATITAAIAQFNQFLVQYNAAPHIGTMAPEINLPDTSGKPFALSSLRGKYVLVDFWASWCSPCRGENPKVVKAYDRFKDKNFTVLGVSLDKDKREWINAIDADRLAWQHVSDLQNWNSAAVTLYKFDTIPYNVLIDPQGKIIAVGLYGEDLENKLTEVLK